MLVLGRKIHQGLLIGDNTLVKVLGVDKKSGVVRLGIDAPKEVNVVREEIIGRDRKKEK